MTRLHGTSPGAGYVVMALDRLVLQDLVETILDFDPRAAVKAAGTCDQALRLIRSMPRLRAAFIEASPLWSQRSGAARAVTALGGHLVLLGDEAEDDFATISGAARTELTLERPFSTEMVHALLARLPDPEPDLPSGVSPAFEVTASR